MRYKLSLTLVSVLVVSACEATPKDPNSFQYWQRSSASSAIYMQGPKAQQMLHRDIARCVSEVKGLERLNNTKDVLIVEKRIGRLLDPDRKKMLGYDTPEYNGYLLSEHKDYQDFDACMAFKGWERTRYINYEIADRARDNYLKSLESYSYQSEIGQKHENSVSNMQTGGENLNE